ncbi:MAG: glycosyltransferase [Chloroflexi bacterium]|nr:glycosyltransferase [Chloroflexota bacterium]
MSEYEPLVSIVTTTLNSKKYLRDCIESVLGQTYPRIEHVLVDGGSSDGTIELIQRYQARYPDKICLTSGQDKNACDAWNKGWGMASGDILGWLGSDDIYESDTIDTVVECFRLNPNEVFVFGDCRIIDDITGKNEIFRAKDFNLDEAINDACHIHTAAAFYKREIIEKTGLMDISLNACDRDYWIRVGKVFPMHRVNRVLATWRLHSESVSGAKGISRTYARENFIICRRHGGRILSGCGIRYFGSGIIEFFWPVLGPCSGTLYTKFAYPIARSLGRVLRI